VPIISCKVKATPEVWPNPSLSLNDVQSMINFVLERQEKSINELMRRLIEEQDRKNLLILMSILLLLLLTLLIFLKQVAHRQAALQG
jgi:hypothetical protein